MNPLEPYYLPNPKWHQSVDCLVCYNVSVVISTSQRTYSIDVEKLLQEFKSHVPKRDVIKERDEILKADQLSEYRILCQEICRLPYRFQREFFTTPIFGTTPSLFYIATAKPAFLECYMEYVPKRYLFPELFIDNQDHFRDDPENCFIKIVRTGNVVALNWIHQKVDAVMWRRLINHQLDGYDTALYYAASDGLYDAFRFIYEHFPDRETRRQQLDLVGDEGKSVEKLYYEKCKDPNQKPLDSY